VLDGDLLAQRRPLGLLGAVGGFLRLLLEPFEVGQLGVLDLLEPLLEGLPLPAFPGEVGLEGVAAALGALPVVLVVARRLSGVLGPVGAFVVSSVAVAAASGVVVPASWSDMVRSPSRRWTRPGLTPDGSMCDPLGVRGRTRAP
jgi:hypothetical protein